MGLNKLALKAEESIKRSGGMPQMFGTITVSDGISMGTEGMKYSLVSREVIADSIETACNAQSMDGVLAIGGCDKNMPGAMIAIARMNIPSIFIYGGTIKPGKLHGVMVLYPFATPIIGLLKSSSLNPTALNIDLLGDLCTPWVIADDLSLFILFENLFYSIAPTLQVASSHQQLQN